MSSTQELDWQSWADSEDQTTSGVYTKQGPPLVRGVGARLTDASGQEFIDCVAGIGTGNVGHSHPIVVAAIQHQASQLTICPEIFHHEERAKLQRRLVDLGASAGIERVFCCNSGAEAVEAALKFAKIVSGRPGVVAAMRGFHGRSMGALSATWEKKYREPFEPLVPGFSHVPYGKLDRLDAAIGDETGAVLLEVIQGEGGVRVGTAEYLQGAQALCRERGAFLILDEVQTGIGRTGRTFAYEHFDLRPDLVCLAKSLAAGVPIGAVLIGERLGAIPGRVHGSTFGGNPLAAAAANAVLDVLEDEGLCARAERLGGQLRAQLRALESPHVREIRGLGLMIGIELKRKVGPLVTALRSRGVLALGAGATVLRLLPPLVISEADLAAVVAAIDASLKELKE
ncbi:MAG: acetylornithine/succinylornithine family transaminase [Planctomycetes bacterium]|nr:acetylornithine/succinylornithine family transaminase [Planctomycetota bacterium]